jgi:hypothetical protein
MPVVYADVAEIIWYNEDSSAPMTVSKPASFGPGQILIAVQIAHGGTLADLTAPSGAGNWTQKDSDSVSSLVYKTWSHAYDGSEPSTWDFGYNGGADVCLGLVRITGADMTPTLVINSTGFGETTSSMDSGSVTPTDYIDLLLSFLAFWGNGTALTETDPPGMADLGQTQVAGNFMSLTAVKENLVSSVPTGVRTWTNVPTVATPGFTVTIAVDSLGTFDPDPPLKPPAAEIPPWLFHELVTAKERVFTGADQQFPTPVIKEVLAANADTASVNLNTASTTLGTDLLVCFHGADFDAATNMTTPTGGTWTFQTLGDNGTNSYHIKVWTRTANAGANSVTVPAVGSSENFQGLLVISGADLASPIDGSPAGSNGGASTSHVAPSVSPVTPSSLLLNAALAAVTNYTKPDPQALSTELIENDGNFSTLTVASQPLGASGATGTKTFISSVSSAFASVSLAIKAAGSAGGGIPDTTVTVGQIDSSEAFGLPTITTTATISAGSITSSESVGASTVTTTYTVTDHGITSSEALGNPSVTVVTPINANGISSSESVGNAAVTATYTIQANGISSSEVLGNSTVATVSSVQANGISSSERLGNPTVVLVPVIYANGISSSERIGAATVTTTYTIQANGISSSEVLGNSNTQTATSIVAHGISSSERIGSPSVTTTYTIQAGGISSTETFGNANTAAISTINANGITSSERLGSPSLSVITAINSGSITSEERLGNAAVTTTYTVQANGIPSSDRLGQPTIQVAATINAGSITSSERFGNTVLVPSASTITAAGIVSGFAIGNAQVSLGAPSLNIAAHGIGSSERIGNPYSGKQIHTFVTWRQEAPLVWQESGDVVSVVGTPETVAAAVG